MAHVLALVDDCGAIGGMNDWQGNRSARSKPAPVPLWNPSGRGRQSATNRLSYGTNCVLLAVAEGSRRLTASATALTVSYWPWRRAVGD
jgi:hypothetical protein